MEIKRLGLHKVIKHQPVQGQGHDQGQDQGQGQLRLESCPVQLIHKLKVVIHCQSIQYHYVASKM